MAINPEEELVLEHVKMGAVKLKVDSTTLEHVRGTIIAHVTAGIVHLGQLGLSRAVEMKQLSFEFPFLADTIMRPPELYRPDGTALSVDSPRGDLGARLATIAMMMDDQLS